MPLFVPMALINVNSAEMARSIFKINFTEFLTRCHGELLSNSADWLTWLWPTGRCTGTMTRFTFPAATPLQSHLQLSILTWLTALQEDNSLLGSLFSLLALDRQGWKWTYLIPNPCSWTIIQIESESNRNTCMDGWIDGWMDASGIRQPVCLWKKPYKMSRNCGWKPFLFMPWRQLNASLLGFCSAAMSSGSELSILDIWRL